MNDDDLLYHYTSAAGLLGIVGTPSMPATFWLSQIQYMNDAEEWYHAYKLARAEILKFSRRTTGIREVMKGLYGIPHEELSTIGPQGLDVIESFGMSRHFTFSLSQEKDLLSQWRGYAPLGGYSVGFKVRDLRNLANRNGFKLVRCIYEKSEKEAAIASQVDLIEQNLRNEIIDPTIELPDGFSPRDKALATARVRFQESVNQFATYFKHESFKEESEWRIVGIVGGGATDQRARWRVRGNLILPYCCLDIGPAGPSPVPVREIVVGPGVDSRLAAHSIQFLAFGRDPWIEIVRSKSTLRI